MIDRDDTIRSTEDLERAVHEVEPGLPIFEVTEMPELEKLIKEWNKEKEEDDS